MLKKQIHVINGREKTTTNTADLMFIYVGVMVAVIIIDKLRDRHKRKKLLQEKQRKSKFYNFIIE